MLVVEYNLCRDESHEGGHNVDVRFHRQPLGDQMILKLTQELVTEQHVLLPDQQRAVHLPNQQ